MKKTLTILVADDDATHREVLRTLLEEWGLWTCACPKNPAWRP